MSRKFDPSTFRRADPRFYGPHTSNLPQKRIPLSGNHGLQQIPAYLQPLPPVLPPTSAFDPHPDIHLRSTPSVSYYNADQKRLTIDAPNGFAGMPYGFEIPHDEHLVQPLVHRLRGEVLKPTPHLPPCNNDRGKVLAARALGQHGCPVIPVSRTNVAPGGAKQRAEFYGPEHTRGCEFFPDGSGMPPLVTDSTTPWTRISAGGARPYESFDLRPE